MSRLDSELRCCFGNINIRRAPKLPEKNCSKAIGYVLSIHTAMVIVCPTVPHATDDSLQISQWLELFTKAKQGDERLQAVLGRYNRMIGVKREKEHWKRILRDELVRLPHAFSLRNLTYPPIHPHPTRHGNKSCATGPSSQGRTSARPYTTARCRA